MKENIEKESINTLSEECQVQQVLAKYVRATDRQDGEAMKNLFTADGKVEVFYLQKPVTISQH